MCSLQGLAEPSGYIRHPNPYDKSQFVCLINIFDINSFRLLDNGEKTRIMEAEKLVG